VLGREANPVLALGRWPSWDAYVASLSQKLRYELRHDERALAARHRIQFHRTLTPDRLEADLDTMLALHRERWKHGRSSFTPREAFHRKFAAIALERGWLRLWILEVDGRPAAARYDFQYAGVHNAYNAGRDPAWRKEGVGLVLRAHSMREAMNEGVSEYRFLRGAESYKTRFRTEDEGLVTIGIARTWLGRRVAQVGDFLKEHPQLRRMAAKVVRYRPPVGDEA
jgi:CelD/BcsL family acetyltransferase involved in cellulose biosynthesis